LNQLCKFPSRATSWIGPHALGQVISLCAVFQRRPQHPLQWLKEYYRQEQQNALSRSVLDFVRESFVFERRSAEATAAGSAVLA